MTDTGNIVSRGFTQVQFTDQYGEERTIYRQKGHNLRVKKRSDTVSHKLNRSAAILIGNKIKERRIKAGLTLEALLLKAGLAAGAGQAKHRMFEIERAGNRVTGEGSRQFQGVRFGTLYALSVALNCDASDLLPTSKEVASHAGVTLTKSTQMTVQIAADVRD